MLGQRWAWQHPASVSHLCVFDRPNSAPLRVVLIQPIARSKCGCQIMCTLLSRRLTAMSHCVPIRQDCHFAYTEYIFRDWPFNILFQCRADLPAIGHPVNDFLQSPIHPVFATPSSLASLTPLQRPTQTYMETTHTKICLRRRHVLFSAGLACIVQ